MKITLLSFYNRFEEYSTKYSLGIMKIASYIKSKNNDVELSIMPINLDAPYSQDIASKITSNNTDILGIPNYIWTKDFAQKISLDIRKTDPSILRVVGGPETPFINFSDWNDDEIFILGEGERAWDKICKARQSDSGFGANQINILGCDNVFSKAYPEFDKKYLFSASEIVQGIPLFSNELENSKYDKSKEDFAWYETSRGCLYNCGYCGHKTRKKLGFVDLDQITAEFEGMKKAGIKRLFIVDPILGGTKEQGKEILKLCHKIIPQTKLIIYLRPELLDNEYIELLTQTNLEEARLGIQTLNSKVPSWIRSNNIDKIQEELLKLFQKNVNWKAELIVGLPGDNFSGLKQTINDVVTKFQPTVLAAYHLTAIKGTRLYDLVDGTNKDLWLDVNEKSQAERSYSYSEKEFKKMAQYATLFTNLYNIYKEKYPNKIIPFLKIDRKINFFLLEANTEKLQSFDDTYAKSFLYSKLPELNQKILTIIRHGQSIGNVKRIIQGRANDFSLSDEGKQQIRNISDKLPEFSQIISSPLQRAKETASIIQQKHQKTLIIDDRLVEMNPGILGGRTHQENYEQFPEYYQIWMKRKDLDGILGAERGKELQARAISFLMDYYNQQNFSDLIVTHAGFMRVLINTINGKDRTTPVNIENASIQSFYNPLSNVLIETRPRAMASKVYIISTVNDKYVVKMKDRNINENDIVEKDLLKNISETIDDVPQVLSLANTKSGSTKVLDFLEGKHVYGLLTRQEQTALTQKIQQISRALNEVDSYKYPKIDVIKSVFDMSQKAKTAYIKNLAGEIINDKVNIKRLEESPVGLVHSDLNRDNILFEYKDGGIKAKVIDWEGISVLPKAYQMASYLSSSLLLEGESVENCLNIAKQETPKEDSEFMLYLMKIRLLQGLYFFAEEKNKYTRDNTLVSEEILDKYYRASKKITIFEKMKPSNDNSVISCISMKKESRGL